MSAARLTLLAALIPALFVATALGMQVRGLHADLQTLAAHPTYSAAWHGLGEADYEDFMAFCRRHVPPSGVVVNVALQPALGYYRAAYDLYPRTVWPVVSPLGLRANDPPRVTPGLLRSVLAHTKARYLAVWHVALPRPLPRQSWVAAFAPGEYVVALG